MKSTDKKHSTAVFMTCKDVEDFMLDYVDGELNLITRLRFLVHIGMCSDCRKYLKSYENTIQLGHHLFEDPDASAGAHVPEAILNAIMQSVTTGK